MALGVEAFGGWSADSLDTLRQLAAARCEAMPPRVRLGTQLRLLRRWWGLLALATQQAVARAISRGSDADMAPAPMEPVVALADLAA